MSGHPVQEEDRVASGKIIGTAVVSLALFGVGALWSVKIQRDEMKSIVTPAQQAPDTKIGQPEVGIVYQKPFNTSAYAEEKVQAKTDDTSNKSPYGPCPSLFGSMTSNINKQ